MKYRNPILTWLLLIAAILMSCTTTRKVYVPVVSNRSHTITLHDTVIVTESVADSAIVFTADTTSTLHTSRATSTASIIDGKLYHSLHQPARVDSVTASIPHHHTVDSIAYPVYVDRVETITVTPTWAWLALSCLCALVIILFMTHFRRK